LPTPDRPSAHEINRVGIRGGLFGPRLDLFAADLTQLGYAREAVQKQLRLLNVFDRWLRQRGVVLFDLSDTVVALFLEGL